MQMMQLFAQDARYTMRQWRRGPGFALFTTLILALGIGTVTAMFTITYGVLLQPLPFQDSDRLFQPIGTAKGDDDFSASYSEISGLQRSTRDTAEIAFTGGGFNIVDTPAGALMVSPVESSSNLFSLLGVEPFIGRGFLSDGRDEENQHVVVLGYGLWRQSFSGDRSVVGKSVHMGGITYVV